MQKLASNLIRQAKALANIDNTHSFEFSELFDYLNASFREVYVSMIEAGDLNYVKELQVSGGEFALPEDFFQLAYVRTSSLYGQGIDLERDYDYQIRNGCLSVNGFGSVLIGYYPKPDLITFKAEKKEVTLGDFVPISAWDTMVIDNQARIYDFREESNIKSTESEIGSYILGTNTYLNTTTKTVYDFTGNIDNTYTTPILRTDGTFNEDLYSTGHVLGWSNEDGSVEFTVNEGNLYYTDENGTELIVSNYTPGLNARVVFLDGQFVLVDLKRITWKDGSWQTTDVSKARVLCKASIETGYGYISKDGNRFFLNGWMPETKVDFPNNIFFDMIAYDMAIQMRRKLNMDSSDLIEGYNDRKGQYVMTLSADGANFPTVRNTRSPFGHFSF